MTELPVSEIIDVIPSDWLEPNAVVPVTAETVRMLLEFVHKMGAYNRRVTEEVEALKAQQGQGEAEAWQITDGGVRWVTDNPINADVALHKTWVVKPLYLAPVSRDAVRDEVDAERYRHILEHGFPVRNQTPHTPDLTWIAFRGVKSFFGATPEIAIDAANELAEAVAAYDQGAKEM